jgi:hypothetical protein
MESRHHIMKFVEKYPAQSQANGKTPVMQGEEVSYWEKCRQW